MQIQTTRFGELSIQDKDVLTFPQGILGFETLKKFTIIDSKNNPLILWLQSLENPKIAFPVIEPKFFEPQYNLELTHTELTDLQCTDTTKLEAYSILTIPQNVALMSVNLKAPLVVNRSNNLCRQIIMQNNKLPVKLEAYQLFKSIPRTQQKRSHLNLKEAQL